MTSKAKLSIVAAQLIAEARGLQRYADTVASFAAIASEERAAEILRAFEAQGVIDGEGVLSTTAADRVDISRAARC